MGSFSWTRAEATTKRSNFAYGDKYKILVPKKFGGGYIKDIYCDYGKVFGHSNCAGYHCYVDSDGVVHYPYPVADLYGILAYWNNCSDLVFEGDYCPYTMTGILLRGKTHEQVNRTKGIAIGCYDEEVDALEFPLKLVSASYKGTYEECKGRSYGDPAQGFRKRTWLSKDYKRILSKIQSTHTKSVTRSLDTLIDGNKLQSDIMKLEELKQQCSSEDSELFNDIICIFRGLLSGGQTHG